jgi:hypothetical protein
MIGDRLILISYRAAAQPAIIQDTNYQGLKVVVLV